jgi:hypothetical protein
MIRNSFLLSVGAAVLAIAPLCHAQNEEPPGFDSAIAIIRTGVLANKTAIIAQVMKLDDKEAASFWPIYRSYEFERSKLEDQRVDVIKEYTDKYPDLTDSEATEISHRMFDCDRRTAALKKAYFGKFNKVLPALKVAEFFQLERRIDLMVDMKVESTLPPIAQAQYSKDSQ